MKHNKLFTIIGNPISHSLSPTLHNFWFSKYKFNFKYMSSEINESQIKQIIDNNMSFNHTKLINVDASSSFIRKNIFHINEISGILDQRVLKYINSKGLYN